MPFEKKKKYKTAQDYKQKILYLNEDDPYQYECLKMLDLSKHKQAKFIGLLVHDYVQRMHINVDTLDEKTFKQLLALLEAQLSGGMNGAFPQMGMMMQPFMMQQPMYQMPGNVVPMTKAPEPEPVKEESSDDEFISKDDMADMERAIQAFSFG